MKNTSLKISLLAAVFSVFALNTPSAQIMDRHVEIQFQRFDSILSNVLKENDELRQQMRSLQKANDALQKDNENMYQRLTELEDEIITVSNMDIAGLKANQQKIFNDVPIFNWGSETRDCPELGEHQQIKLVQSKDKRYSLRYLCFDGRVLHIGTEVHEPPQ